jgi:hypothetical protein
MKLQNIRRIWNSTCSACMFSCVRIVCTHLSEHGVAICPERGPQRIQDTFRVYRDLSLFIAFYGSLLGELGFDK